jgi:hypothetical protein
VIGIFYVGGMVVPLGESVHTFFHPKDGSWTPPPFVRFYVCFPSLPLYCPQLECLPLWIGKKLFLTSKLCLYSLLGANYMTLETWQRRPSNPNGKPEIPSCWIECRRG